MFGKPKKLTFKDKLDRELFRTEEWVRLVKDFYPRLERLDMLYPGVIRQVDLCIGKRINLREDCRVPEEFLCSCKLLGLRVKEVKENRSYARDHEYYISIEFYDEVMKTEDCD